MNKYCTQHNCTHRLCKFHIYNKAWGKYKELDLEGVKGCKKGFKGALIKREKENIRSKKKSYRFTEQDYEDLKFFLKEKNIKLYEIANRFEMSYSHLSMVIHGRKGATARLIKNFEEIGFKVGRK